MSELRRVTACDIGTEALPSLPYCDACGEDIPVDGMAHKGNAPAPLNPWLCEECYRSMPCTLSAAAGKP